MGNVIEFCCVVEVVCCVLGDKGYYFLLVISSVVREGRFFVVVGFVNVLSE